jgi:hypothetical protein
MLDRLVIERIELATLDHTTINNNNLSKDVDDIDAQSKDYGQEVDKTRLCNYLDLVKYPVSWSFELTPVEAKILIDAGQVSTTTMRRSHLYDEELEQIEQRLQEDWIDDLYFIRLDRCSTKDGNPAAPLISPRDVINSIITSNRAMKALKYGDTRIYFVRFDPNWDEMREVRVFVHQGHVTSISQYNPYQVGFFNNLSEEQLHHIVNNIQIKIAEIVLVVANRIQTDDFVADLYIEDSFQPRLIELNSFGYWLASGSALFNWNTDREKLYGNGSIYLRFLV